jgi:hypothetical protein
MSFFKKKSGGKTPAAGKDDADIRNPYLNALGIPMLEASLRHARCGR